MNLLYNTGIKVVQCVTITLLLILTAYIGDITAMTTSDSISILSENQEMKVCPKCGQSKSINYFYKNKCTKDGLEIWCKSCKSDSAKKYYSLNKLKISSKQKEYYNNNKDKRLVTIAKWRENNPEKVKNIIKTWRSENRDKVKISTNKWKKQNPDKIKILKAEQYKRYRKNPSFVLSGSLSKGIRYSLKKGITKNNTHWADMVDYTAEQLKNHLEKQFDDNMSWDNYGSYWHIDHIIPIAAFNFEKPEDEDFRICWSLKNLRPLESKENLSKGAKIEKPFQPSLVF